MTEAAVKTRPPIVRRVLSVARKEQVTPNLLRVILTGDEVADFHMVTTGINNKLFIPPKGVAEVHFPDFVGGAWAAVDEHLTPKVRTYTLRALDLERREMAIDFALHGSGAASEWAENAQAGDKLGVAMKGITKQLYPGCDWILLVADLSAVPVTSVILETLPAATRGMAIIEVPSEDDIHEIKTASAVEIRWIVNPTPGVGMGLCDAAMAVELPGSDVRRFVHAAAEFAVIRKLREHFRKGVGLSPAEFHGFGYWSYGVAEDASAIERHDESHS